MRVAFCCSEAFPFAKTGGLADVCGTLPSALEKIGVEGAVFLPGYACAARAGYHMEPVTATVSRVVLSAHLSVYFIGHEDYFGRDGLYGDARGDYPDNINRFGYYCSEVLKLLKQLDFKPDVVHCHDWQTALIPVHLTTTYRDDPFYAKTKTVFTIHNLAFQGAFPRERYPVLGVGMEWEKDFEFYGRINLMRAGLIHSDVVTTVSPQYAKEILTREFGCGLENVLRSRQGKVLGILNGVDHDIWDPQTDQFIAAQYGAGDFDDAKLANKMQLQKELGLEVRDDVPLFGFVGRLSHQKGLDVILEVFDDMIRMDAQMVFLGQGDSRYQEQLKEKASLFPENAAVCFDFNEPLAHRIYAGSDLFLMPSRFEPCGLSQMISLRYGTIPVVFRTGGLADTVKPFGAMHKDGNGLVFTRHSQADFLGAVKRAVKVFGQDEEFYRLRKNAFKANFSWREAANRYAEIYHGRKLS